MTSKTEHRKVKKCSVKCIMHNNNQLHVMVIHTGTVSPPDARGGKDEKRETLKTLVLNTELIC